MLDCSKSCFKIFKYIKIIQDFCYFTVKPHLLLNMWSTRSFLYAPSLTGSSPWLRVSLSLPAPNSTAHSRTHTHHPCACWCLQLQQDASGQPLPQVWLHQLQPLLLGESMTSKVKGRDKKRGKRRSDGDAGRLATTKQRILLTSAGQIYPVHIVVRVWLKNDDNHEVWQLQTPAVLSCFRSQVDWSPSSHWISCLHRSMAFLEEMRWDTNSRDTHLLHSQSTSLSSSSKVRRPTTLCAPLLALLPWRSPLLDSMVPLMRTWWPWLWWAQAGSKCADY